MLLLFISLYIRTIFIFIFSSLHFICLFRFCATPFTHPVMLPFCLFSHIHIKPLTPYSIEENWQETSLFTPLSLSRAQDLMSKVNIRCKIPTIYHLQSQVYLPAAVFAKIIQHRHNLFWISTQRSLRKKSWCWAVLSMTELLDLPATSGDIFKEKSLLISPIVSAMCTHTQTYTHAFIYIYMYTAWDFIFYPCV